MRNQLSFYMMCHKPGKIGEVQIWNQICPKNMTDKNVEKINIKIVTSIQQCIPLQNFSHFVELQIMGPNFPQKNINDKNFEKTIIKIIINIKQCTSVPNFC